MSDPHSLQFGYVRLPVNDFGNQAVDLLAEKNATGVAITYVEGLEVGLMLFMGEGCAMPNTPPNRELHRVYIDAFITAFTQAMEGMFGVKLQAIPGVIPVELGEVLARVAMMGAMMERAGEGMGEPQTPPEMN